VQKLQQLRDMVKRPVRITSGYRTPAYNSTCPGAADGSQHLYGKAADITISGLTPDEVFEIVNPMFNGVGRYNNFTHCDIRDYYARWDSRTPTK
jgi:uncharacterized protein YcbK (DUF882 family)